MAEGAIKLNLGAGPKILPGYINVDLPNNWSDVKPDVEADLTKPLPFPDNHADEVMAIHVIEHFNRWDAPIILKDWVRVLKPGGLLILECPCLDKILSNYAHAMIDRQHPDPRLTILGLYGDPAYKNQEMMHRWCYSIAELAAGLKVLGLEDITPEEPQTHQPARDMRMTARKPRGSILLGP